MNPEMPFNPPPLVPKIVGYCRVCGKSLDETTARNANGTIYCEDHFPPAREGAPPPFGATPPPIGASPYTPYTAPYAAPVASSPYTATPVANPGVSTSVAFALGLIPGVGAIYNGQYAKGIVHALILGVLLTAASTSIPGIPDAVSVLLVISFWAYMPFEAYHTARRRQAGQSVDEFSGLAGGAGAASRFPAAAVLLIAFGVVFLLNNLDMLDLRRIARFWPVLLIGMGVYLLWNRLVAGQTDNGSKRDGGRPGGQS